MSAQQPRNIPENQIKHTDLIDTPWMKAIKSMYADRANEVMDKLSKMDKWVRDILIGAIKWAHQAMEYHNAPEVTKILNI